MKIAVLSESAADEAALHILAAAILAARPEPANVPTTLRTRGWTSICPILPTVIDSLYYGTDAEVLLVVMDSDKSPIHRPAHEQSGNLDAACRLCQAREVAAVAQRRLRPVPNRAPIRLAFGLAVPCIEAWYRCGLDPHVSEATWDQALQSGKYPYDGKRLKLAVYGNDRPSLDLETRCATDQANRLAQNINQLEIWFPAGFGSLVTALRSAEGAGRSQATLIPENSGNEPAGQGSD